MPSYPIRLLRRGDRAGTSGAWGLPAPGRRGAPAGALATFTRSLAATVAAGLPVLEALDTAAQGSHRTVEAAVRAARAEVARGVSLSDALAARPHVFDGLYVRLVAVGEATGRLPALLERLAGYLEKDHLLRRRLLLALVYPGLLVGVGAAVTAFLVLVIVPTFADLFADFGTELPRPTRLVLAWSDRLGRTLPWLGPAALGAGLGLQAARRTTPGRNAWDAAGLRLPLFGAVARKNLTARFCRTLGTLLEGGVDLVDALHLASDTAGHARMEQAAKQMRSDVLQGGSLAQSAGKTPVFPPLAARMIAVGEATAQLDRMLLHAAAYYEREAEDALEALTAALEPALIVLLGALLGGLLTALYLPMFELGGLVR